LVVIRLTRVGKKKQAHYRIVVADSRKAVQAKFISILGWYNPHTKELQVKKDELQAWFDKGAMPSNTLAKLLKQNKIDLPKWVKIEEKNKKSKQKEQAVKQAPKTEEKAAEGEEAVETPAEEVKEEAPAEGAEAEAIEEVAEKTEEAEEKAEEPAVEEEKAEETEETKEEDK